MEISKKASNKSKIIRDKEFEKLTEKLNSEKDVKKLVSSNALSRYFRRLIVVISFQIKQQAKTAMKKSKIIKMNNDVNHKRNVKLSQRKKHLKEKMLRKHKKIPKHKSK